METPRERARRQTMDDIVRLGREQLATTGPADLSLRQVARDLGLVSSAVYRYVKDRDALLTLLIVDAYDELGQAVEDAVAAASRRTHRRRLLAAAHAMRDWSLREPSRFALLYGTPVAGYRAPSEQTNQPGTRVALALAGVLDDAARRGVLLDVDAPLPASVGRDMARIADEFDLVLPPVVLARALGLWSALVGACAFDVFEQYGPDTLTDPRAFFETHVAALADGLGLPR